MRTLPEEQLERRAFAARHARFGWWLLFCSATVGLLLESFQGLRVQWYVDVTAQTRRHMFTLAHAHGSLLGLVNVVFALCLRSPLLPGLAHVRPSSLALLGASLAIPVGFLAGGVVIYDGDPGLGIVLVPIGGLVLLAATIMVARGTRA